jgi:hypothetical protein
MVRRILEAEDIATVEGRESEITEPDTEVAIDEKLARSEI